MIVELLIAGVALCEPIELPPAEPEIAVRRVKTETIRPAWEPKP
jgi:hypothetical protein